MKWNYAIAVASLATVVASGAAVIIAQGEKPTMQVYKTATCGCCAKWVDHLKANGFAVNTTDVDDIDAVKKKHGVPTELGSCHTGLVNGYVVEGHVPAADVARMLKERPKILGIAVPAMPAGSPGMEIPSGRVQPYRVLTFGKDGKTTVFATHGGAAQ